MKKSEEHLSFILYIFTPTTIYITLKLYGLKNTLKLLYKYNKKPQQKKGRSYSLILQFRSDRILFKEEKLQVLLRDDRLSFFPFESKQTCAAKTKSTLRPFFIFAFNQFVHRKKKTINSIHISFTALKHEEMF